MNERLRNHIEKLFEGAPKTRKAFELKEELLANSEERYQDLIANGVSSDDAFKHVVSSIGNVSELFRGLEAAQINDREEYEERTRKIAIIKTAAVGLYIFSVFLFLTFALFDVYSPLDLSTIGLAVMIFLAIIPTCMLVYVSNMYPRYRKKEDTIVEDFKEWKSDSVKTKSIKGAVTCIVWTSTLLLYFAVSFATFDWYATWIIFIAAACVQAIVELIFRLKELKK
jgi:O-antigen/teichoic acid export membrane protein